MRVFPVVRIPFRGQLPAKAIPPFDAELLKHRRQHIRRIGIQILMADFNEIAFWNQIPCVEVSLQLAFVEF